MLRALSNSLRLRRFAGRTLADYLAFVRKTSSLVVEPDDFYERAAPHLPAIIAMWHGQHFMMPFARPPNVPVRVMISRSADGEVNAVAAERLGLGLIRASGGQTARQIRKRGGARGFLECLRALEAGATVALTADVPKGPARVAGPGIVALAQHSGRPILALAFATSRRITVTSAWDKASINLPFSRAALVGGEPIVVPREADAARLEELRRAVEASLDRVTARAYSLVDGHAG